MPRIAEATPVSTAKFLLLFLLALTVFPAAVIAADDDDLACYRCEGGKPIVINPSIGTSLSFLLPEGDCSRQIPHSQRDTRRDRWGIIMMSDEACLVEYISDSDGGEEKILRRDKVSLSECLSGSSTLCCFVPYCNWNSTTVAGCMWSSTTYIQGVP